MPFTRVGGISHVIGGGDCPRRHNSRNYTPRCSVGCRETEESWYVGKYVTPMW
jgi:hypothetical protein